MIRIFMNANVRHKKADVFYLIRFLSSETITVQFFTFIWILDKCKLNGWKTGLDLCRMLKVG